MVRMGPGLIEKGCQKEVGGQEMLPSARLLWPPAPPTRTGGLSPGRPLPGRAHPAWRLPGAGVMAQHEGSKLGLRP